MARTLLRVVGALVVVLTLGLGGWVLWELRLQQRRTAQQLQDTTASLDESRKTLTMVEEARRQLSKEYDTLKGRWSQSEAELAALKQVSAQMTEKMAVLASDRSQVTRQLDDATAQTGRLTAQVGSLERRYALVEAQKAALEGQLRHAMGTSVTLAEVEQLQAAMTRDQEQTERLHDHVLDLSRAYEQLAQGSMRERLVAEAPQGRRPTDAPSGAPPPETRLSQAPQPPSPAERRRLAQRYGRLGDAYLAAYQYPQAVEAFERVLTFEENPTVHAKLAFIYSRILHNPEKAQPHAMLAASHRQDPTVTALGSMASAEGFPRRGWRLLWTWLTQ